MKKSPSLIIGAFSGALAVMPTVGWAQFRMAQAKLDRNQSWDALAHAEQAAFLGIDEPELWALWAAAAVDAQEFSLAEEKLAVALAEKK